MAVADRFAENAAQGKAMTTRQNLAMVDYGPLANPDFMRPTLYRVYLYSVSERQHPGKPGIAFEVCRPSLNIPLLQILPKPKDKRYVEVTSIPHPFPLPYIDQTNGEIKYSDVPGQRVAMDICNPNNMTLDQDAFIDPQKLTGDGDNLNTRGVFWSLNNPPKEEEVERAYQRMEKYYTGLLERASALEMSDRQALEEALRQNPDYGIAAEYFGKEFSWHQQYVRKAALVECPNCGEQVKSGVAFHKSDSLGIICVLDWDRTIAAGAKKEADRPMAATPIKKKETAPVTVRIED